MSEVSYHGWTHRPKALGGTDPIPGQTTGALPWARLGGGGGTAVTNTWTNADFSDAMAFNEPAFGDVFVFNDEGDRWSLDLVADGIYLIQYLVSWTNTFAEPSSLRLQAGSDDQLYNEFYGLTWTRPHSNTTYGPFHNIDRVMGFFFRSETVDAPTLDPQVHQLSGSNRSFDAYSLRVVYFGELGPDASWFFDST